MSKLISITISLLLAAATGCTSQKSTAFNDHVIKTAASDSSRVHLASISATHQDGNLEVSGLLMQSGISHIPLSCHLDITLLDQDGNLIKSARTEQLIIPIHRIGNGSHTARFNATIPLDFPQDMTVLARPHSDKTCAL